jgi:hypothetical protein
MAYVLILERGQALGMDFMGIGPVRYALMAPRTTNKFAIRSWFEQNMCLVMKGEF